jgi:hypothetical protein
VTARHGGDWVTYWVTRTVDAVTPEMIPGRQGVTDRVTRQMRTVTGGAAPAGVTRRPLFTRGRRVTPALWHQGGTYQCAGRIGTSPTA